MTKGSLLRQKQKQDTEEKVDLYLVEESRGEGMGHTRAY